MKNGFTLAEVLITLGIIGVVCALTLPSLIEKHQKQVTITKLKKIYSVLSQQILLANSQTTPANEFLTTGDKVSADSVEEFFQTYWMPYFNGAKILNDRPYNGTSACQYKQPDGECFPTDIYTDYNFGRIVLSTNDGYILFICLMYWKDDEALYSPSQQVFIDINGLKGPNIFGKDIFRVVMNYDKNNVKPYDIDKSVDDINSNCSRNGSGEACFAKIVREGWKISNDYPW